MLSDSKEGMGLKNKLLIKIVQLTLTNAIKSYEYSINASKYV